MIRLRGPSGSTAPARNGRRPATARRWKAIRTARSRSSAATRSSSSRPTATTWFTPTARPRPRPCELIEKHAGQPFFLAVGFVRPHVPFVAPKKYFEPFLPYDKLTLPPKVPGDWDDIPKAGINYKTSVNMKMDVRRQKKAVGGYYASVAYMDAQVGKVLDALERSGQAGQHDRHLHQRPRLSPRRARLLGQGQPARRIGDGAAHHPRARARSRRSAIRSSS